MSEDQHIRSNLPYWEQAQQGANLQVQQQRLQSQLGSNSQSREIGIREAVAKAMEALDEAEKKFFSYALHHDEKSETRGDDAFVKAAINYNYALRCEKALELLELYFGRHQAAPAEASADDHA